MSLFKRTEHEEKYDRQTRIWGAHGQQAIETARICVLGANVLGAETLKNLVLPNVHEFYLVDHEAVSKADVGLNFFVDPDSVGRPRAEVVTKLLCEINPDVVGHAVVKNPLDLVTKDVEFFSKFHLVIACRQPEAVVLPLDKYLFSRRIPLLHGQSVGLFASLRLSVPEITVVESHYSNDRSDLRMHPAQSKLFPALEKYCASFDMKTKDSMEFAHIPYPVILMQLVQAWQQAHQGNLPKGAKEREEFKNMIRAAAQFEPTEQDVQRKGFADFENFQEAYKFYYKAIDAPEIDFRTESCFNSDKCENLTRESSHFWVLTRAVRNFMRAEGAGFLPVQAQLPDFTATTAKYIELQEIFKAEAERHVQLIIKHTAALLKSLQRPEDSIPEREIRYFVSNIRGIAAVEGRSLHAERNPETCLTSDLEEVFQEYEPKGDDDGPAHPKELMWYLTMRAADVFYTKHGRHAGSSEQLLEKDTQELLALQKAILEENKLAVEPSEAAAQEIARYGGGELHTVSSFMGGVAAQEALKLIIGQFLPIDNVVVYNGVLSREKMYRV